MIRRTNLLFVFLDVLGAWTYSEQDARGGSVDISFWLRRSQMQVYSQNGEDGILEALLGAIEFASGTAVPPTYVEFGVQDGLECNTRYLRDKGWSGILMDGTYENPSFNLHKRFITGENINGILTELGAPAEFGVLSVDLDLNDWHVWRSILQSKKYRAVVTIVEYNSSIDPDHALVVPYRPNGTWDGSHFYGASLLALTRLGKQHGYDLVACDPSGTNAFFVDSRWPGWPRRDLGHGLRPLPSVDSAFVRAAYVGDYFKNAAEHDAQLSLTVDAGSAAGARKLLVAECPLSPGVAAHGHASGEVQSALLACAREFALQYGLTEGMGCNDSGIDCVAKVLAGALAQRRWLNVNEAGDIEGGE